MSALVEQLKKDHRKLLATLEEVNKLGIGTPQGRATLMAAKAFLLGHLKLEDQKLYPALDRAAVEDAWLRTMLEDMKTEMRKVSRKAVEFFVNYEQDQSGIGFARDFGTLYAVVRDRIQREESVLYPEYDRQHPEPEPVSELETPTDPESE